MAFFSGPVPTYYRQNLWIWFLKIFLKITIIQLLKLLLFTPKQMPNIIENEFSLRIKRLNHHKTDFPFIFIFSIIKKCSESVWKFIRKYFYSFLLLFFRWKIWLGLRDYRSTNRKIEKLKDLRNQITEKWSKTSRNSGRT